MLRRRRAAVLLAALAGALAPRAQVASALPPPAPAESFRSAPLAARYRELWACLAPPAAWVRRERPVGAGREYWFCPPADARCGSSDTAEEYYTLRAFTGGTDERLELLLRRRTSRGITVYLSLQPWTGGFGFHFERAGQSLSLGATAGFAWRELELSTQPRFVQTDVRRWLDAELTPWLRSEGAVREQGLALMDRLQRVVEDSLQRHTLGLCDPAPPPAQRYRYVAVRGGEGAFDTCARRRLTPAEESALRAEANLELGRRRAMLTSHGAELAQALEEAFPLRRCLGPTLRP